MNCSFYGQASRGLGPNYSPIYQLLKEITMPDFVSRDVLRPIRARENINLSWDICVTWRILTNLIMVNITLSGNQSNSQTAISCAEWIFYLSRQPFSIRRSVRFCYHFLNHMRWPWFYPPEKYKRTLGDVMWLWEFSTEETMRSVSTNAIPWGFLGLDGFWKNAESKSAMKVKLF